MLCQTYLHHTNGGKRKRNPQNMEHFKLNTSAADIKCYAIDLCHAVEST